MKLCPFCMRRIDDDKNECPFCGYDGSQKNTYPNSLPVGTRLADRYVTGGVCGNENDFIFYYAYDSSSNKRVKLVEYLPTDTMYRKEIRTHVSFYNIECRSRAESKVTSMLDKCRLLCKVGMNGFLDICDCFEENGTFCYICKTVDGSPLSSIIGNNKPISIKTTIDALMPVFICVRQLHSEGIYHGSISPYNIICSKGQTVSLGGLSLSKGKSLTPYDAPERNIPDQIGAWTDIYSLGAIVYEMVTGSLPVSAQLRKNGRELKFPESVEPKVRLAISKAMSVNPNVRYRSVGDFVAALTGKELPKKDSKPKNSDLMGKIRTALLVISVLCFVVSGGLLVNKYIIEPSRFLKQSKNLISMVTQPEQSDPTVDFWAEMKEKYPDISFPTGMDPKYVGIYAQNTDFAGWVKITELGIDFPLVQGENNDRYLRADFYGNYTQYGQPFFDYRNNLDVLDRNTIVYGHNMRHDNRLFGPLEEYKTVDGFKKAPVITLDTLYGEYKFKIWAVFITNSNAKGDNGHVFNYIYTAASDGLFSKYVAEVEKRKLYDTGVDILPSDKVLTLSTCCYEFSDARLVVVGRMLREGETTEVDTSLAVKNPKPKYPQAFYDAIKSNNPYKNDPDLFE